MTINVRVRDSRTKKHLYSHTTEVFNLKTREDVERVYFSVTVARSIVLLAMAHNNEHYSLKVPFGCLYDIECDHATITYYVEGE